MGQLFEFKKYGKKAIAKEREDRVAKSEARNEQSEKNWKSSAEISSIKEFKAREKLRSLVDWDFIDPKPRPEFSANISEASDYVEMLKSEGGMREDEKEQTFSAELLSVGDQVADNDSFELSDWKDYELKKQDVFLIENLLTALNS